MHKLKSTTYDSINAYNLHAEARRSKLAKMIMRLFDHWKLDTASQLVLLGFKPKSRALLTDYHTGKPLPSSRDLLDRVGWLMVIHEALRSLYPENSKLCYGWITLRNTTFKNETPLDYMMKEGLIGIAKVALYLQSQLSK